MKKNFFYAMMSAIALTGAVCFSSCSSSDELSDVNPTYDGESVKTTFSISIGDVKSPTRMEADPVQKDELFNGMTDIYLFPFTSAVTANSDILESYIHLGDINSFDANLDAANGKIYKDVNLSVGVTDFLFYGVTKTPGNGKLKASYLSMSDANWATGSTNWAPTPIVKGTSKVGVYTTDPINGLTFDLVPIARGWTLATVKTSEKAEKTIAPLNAVDAKISEQITAAAASESVVGELKKLQKTLRNDVSTTTTPNYEFYAGSSASILSLMTMLYNTLLNNAAAYTNGTTNYATDIATVITSYFDPSTGDAPYTLTWKANPEPRFPANLGLPDGAATVQYIATGENPSNKFEYVKPSIEGLTTPAFENYTYPANLYYTVNTKAMVKDEEYLDQESNATKKWDAIRGAYAEGAITASTRSVIMKNQVQYAVGRLDVNVRVKEETIINDNTKDAPQPVSVPATGYQLTGVLIGGQKQVGWDFTPIDDATEMTIWDNTMTGSTANGGESPIFAKQGTTPSSINHTLALETKAGAAINIALEFVNKGNDFCGIDNNLIPEGSKFYLVAKLDPTKYNDQHVEQKPEEEWDDTETVINQVIKQDYVTTVNLIIGENSLKKAYNVVPDLRSPKLEFGLSVDLHWRTGLTFEQTF